MFMKLSDTINRKFVDSIELDDWEVETDNGWVDISRCNKTIEYDVWRLELDNGKWLECADNHIVFNRDKTEVFVKDLKCGDYIITKDEQSFARVKCVKKLDRKEHMYDLSVEGEHTYFTNNILSHNTLFLQNITANAIKANRNVVYLSFEITENNLRKRIDSTFSDLDIKNIVHNREKLRNKIKKLYETQEIGRLFIKEYPTGSCTVLDIENYLNKLKLQKNFVPDLVIVDYLGIMKPLATTKNTNSYERTKVVCEELRGLSGKYRIPFFSATQVNRCLSLDSKVNIEGIGDIDIGEIKEGDKILTNTGYAPVKTVYPITKQKCYKIKTKSGKEIICSAKHIFPTKEGDKTLEQGLDIGDVLYTKGYKEDEIVSIEEVGYEDTIDIELDNEDRVFYANNILTHNSGYNTEDGPKLDNISDSMGIAHTCDLMISLSQPESLKEDNKIRFEVLKSRLSKTGDIGYFKIDYERLKIVNEESDTERNDKLNDMLEKHKNKQAKKGGIK